MANNLLPINERNLTPDQVEALDKRRDLGLPWVDGVPESADPAVETVPVGAGTGV